MGDSENRERTETVDPLKRFGRLVVLIGLTIGGSILLFIISYVLITDTTLFREIMQKHVQAVVGIPMAAASAFVVVFILESRAGTIEFELLKVKFRGASGPVVLWVFTFLAFVIGIWLLW